MAAAVVAEFDLGRVRQTGDDLWMLLRVLANEKKGGWHFLLEQGIQ
jgi:hypothetical protein